jgi:hypothetical protein
MTTYLPPELDADPKALRSQAQRIFDRFNVTPYGMGKLLRMDVTAPYRWLYPAPKGTGGVVPTAAMGRIIRIARREGVLLQSSDFDPRPMP